MTEDAFAVVLAGGRGERLWPLARARRPKALVRIGDRTLLARTMERVAATGIPPERTLLVGPAAHAAALSAEAPGARLLTEPDAGDSARAVALAALTAHRASERAVLAVFPCDHVVADPAPMAAAIRAAIGAAIGGVGAGRGLVAFGTPPRGPSTAYGWLLPGDAPDGAGNALDEYVEKPDAERARALFDSGRYLWSCGTFVLATGALLDAFARFAPDILEAARDIFAGRSPRAAASLSIDHAILEPAARSGLCAVVPVRYERIDLGRLEGLAPLLDADAHGNALAGDVLALHTRDSMLTAGPDAGALAVLGVTDLVVVVEPDVVLVCRKGADTRALLAALRARRREDLL